MRILFLFCDMLRADKLRTSNPNIPEVQPIDKWFNRLGGTCFVNAFTPGSDTSRGLACLYTGLYPDKNGCRKFGQYPKYWLETDFHIFRYLADNGFLTSIFIPPLYYASGSLPPDISDCNVEISFNFKDTLKSIRTKEGDNQAVFMFLEDYHLVVNTRGAHPSVDFKGQMHLSNVFDRIFDEIPVDYFDKIVIFSDHGSEFSDDNNSKLDWVNDNRTRIVLFIHEKGDSKVILERNLATIMDIFPTVIDWLEVGNLEVMLDGRSLLQPGDDSYVVIEDEIQLEHREDFMHSISDIWVYRDNVYRFTDSLYYGSRLQKVTPEGYIDCPDIPEIIDTAREKIALHACFYRVNKKSLRMIRDLFAIRWHKADLMTEANKSVKSNYDKATYDELGYPTHYLDGEPLRFKFSPWQQIKGLFKGLVRYSMNPRHWRQ